MSKKKIFVALMIGLIGVSFTIIVCNRSFKAINSITEANAVECTYHHGYHYAAKEATIDQPGHKEFWACCGCHHQYLTQPEGDFVDRDDAEMMGIIDENHIAYIPPANEGGSDGDYWINDPFED